MEGVHQVFIVLLMLVLSSQAKGLSDTDRDHECLRPCSWPPDPRTCRYDFTVEWSYSMSNACFDCPYNRTDCYRANCYALDGAPRAVAVTNKQFPGPSIQVCEHDDVEVQVNNMLINNEGVSIHWHGLHQRGTPYMDGTSLITQSPIPVGSSFTYRFKADTPGTHWWHSHSGMQRSDGLFGSFVVKQSPTDDPHSSRYDSDLPEHVILVHDWINELALNRYVGHHLSDLSGSPESILVNGRGQNVAYTGGDTNQTYSTPWEVFRVEQGVRYRFRTISNAILDCPIEVSLDDHNLTIIATDGSAVEPLVVSRYVIYGGERYDFILTAERGISQYWMRFKGLGECSNVRGLALVVYNGASSEIPPSPEPTPDTREGVLLNPLNLEPSDTVKTVNQLSAAGNDDQFLDTVSRTFYLGFDFENVTNPNYNDPNFYPAESAVFTSQINRVSFRFTASPLLTQPEDVGEFELCTYESTEAMRSHCETEYCECTHVVNIDLGEAVEFVFIDEGQPFEGSHPVHLHGYNFQVVGMGKLGLLTTVEEVKSLDEAGGIPRNFTKPPRKDTVIIPDGGYVVVRLLADNPGWWFLHCHLEFHNQIGMAVVVHVGEDNDLPPKLQDFPRCGSWYPHGDVIPGTPKPSRSCTAHAPLRYLVLLCFLLSFKAFRGKFMFQ